MSYQWIYVGLIFIFTLYNIIYIPIEKKFSINASLVVNCLLILFFSILIACRPMSVPDTDYYADLFEQIKITQIYDVNYLMVNEFDSEIGFVFFCQAVKFLFGQSVRIFFFIIPLVNISLMAFGAKVIIHHINEKFLGNNRSYSFNYEFGLLLCLYTSYFGLMYNGIALRAGFALSFTICAMAMYLDKKYIVAIICCAIALTFHRMAIIGALLIVIFQFVPAFSRLFYIISWFFMGALVVFHVGDRLIELSISLLLKLLGNVPILSSFSSYLVEYVMSAQFGYKNLFFYIIGLVLVLWKINNTMYYKLINLYYLGLVTMVLFGNIPGASRIYDFMILYGVIALYVFFNNCRESKVMRWAIISGVVLISDTLVLSVWELF